MLKTLFYIFIIYFIYQVVKGFFTANRVVRNFNDAARQHQHSQQNNNQQPEEIDNYKKATDNIGDYVDYEEVEDDTK